MSKKKWMKSGWSSGPQPAAQIGVDDGEAEHVAVEAHGGRGIERRERDVVDALHAVVHDPTVRGSRRMSQQFDV